MSNETASGSTITVQKNSDKYQIFITSGSASKQSDALFDRWANDQGEEANLRSALQAILNDVYDPEKVSKGQSLPGKRMLKPRVVAQSVAALYNLYTISEGDPITKSKVQEVINSKASSCGRHPHSRSYSNSKNVIYKLPV